jgi:KDO2-lipid IV(A) lauroyltransferase
MTQQRLRYALETAAAYTAYGFFSILPIDTASNIGGWIGRKIGMRLAGPTRTARQNLAMAFPEKSAQEREMIILGMWDNLGRVFAEYAHLRSIWQRVEMHGEEMLPSIRSSGKPVIFCGAHLANWEINAVAPREYGVNLHVVYRKPNNPGVDALLRHARDSGASAHIQKGHAGAKEMLAVVRKNGALGILVDQKLNEGIPVPFFGRDAMTAPALAFFAIKFGCAVHPCRIERLKGCRFRMTMLPAVPVPHTGNKDNDVMEMMTGINRLIESWVRERPEQWLWIHHRWG